MLTPDELAGIKFRAEGVTIARDVPNPYDRLVNAARILQVSRRDVPALLAEAERMAAVVEAAREVMRLNDAGRFDHYRIMSNDGAKAMIALQAALVALNDERPAG